MEYLQEMWGVPKDTVYVARDALQLALSYMPQIRTDVPQFQKTLDRDFAKMQYALLQLEALPLPGGVETPKT